MTEEVFTTEDVAKLLKIDAATVRWMARRNEISFFKIGSEYRFTREDVQSYILANHVERQEAKSA